MLVALFAYRNRLHQATFNLGSLTITQATHTKPLSEEQEVQSMIWPMI